MLVTPSSLGTIDDICVGLEPLGDTLGVVVNLQSRAAKSGDELEIPRRCIGRAIAPLPDGVVNRWDVRDLRLVRSRTYGSEPAPSRLCPAWGEPVRAYGKLS